ncbi:MAG: hypothetical protein C0502_00945 [Opitutus sp.]|nr:hypothetical protein [Opitutus sp.]
MENSERVEFERWLQTNPAARQAVEEIRATAALLGTALAAEAGPEAAKPIAAAAIIPKLGPGGVPGQLDGGPLPPVDDYVRQGSKLLRFPALYYTTAGLAAACFAVVFFSTAGRQERKEKTQLIEMDAALAGALRSAEPRSDVQKAREVRAAVAAQTEHAVAMASPVAEPAPVAPGALKPGRFAVAGTAPVARAQPSVAEQEFNTENYAAFGENPFLAVAQNPLSTFAADADTASYANVRRFLRAKQRPPKSAVRIEELVNYFPYRYAPPAAGAAPFAAHLEVASAPWVPEHRLVRIGLKGREVSDAARPPANLVFLLDVSGSMNAPAKLPLVKQSLRLLLERLRPDDRVAIVVYAGASGLALPSTPVREKAKIVAALEELRPGGSTNGAAGIQLAYDIAKANFVAGGVNRVVLTTDGDFNVGVSGESELAELIREKARSGVFLSVLGFGMGNLKDSTLESLADKGNGHYASIDSLAEAKKALVGQAGGTLVTIAKDVKLQVEFNPAEVQAYRLIGYENRMLRQEDFNNDRIDAGEIGAGHTVTALYEIVPVGAALPDTGSVDALKYQRTEGPARKAEERARGELLTLKIRYKEPDGDVSMKLEFPLRDTGRAFAEASADFKFAAAVASFGMILRDSPHRGGATLAQVAAWAREGTMDDSGGYRAEFAGLVAEAAAVLQE